MLKRLIIICAVPLLVGCESDRGRYQIVANSRVTLVHILDTTNGDLHTIYPLGEDAVHWHYQMDGKAFKQYRYEAKATGKKDFDDLWEVMPAPEKDKDPNRYDFVDEMFEEEKSTSGKAPN